jgi:Na+/H+ antiporter NhaD/arsenite permease-like protein
MPVGLAQLSLAALLLVILLSCFTRINVGFLAIALAWLVGLAAGVNANQVISGFPANLFLTLTGVTFLFTQAEVNGTLERIAAALTRLARGNALLVIILFFLLSALLATAGAGALSTIALMAPLGMGAAHRAGISPFLMAIMLGNGANAGNLSPVSPIGVVVHQSLVALNLTDLAWHLYRNHFIAHVLLSVLILLAFGGVRLARQHVVTDMDNALPWERAHWLTVGVITLLMATVLLLKLPVGLAAFAAGCLITILRAAPESTVIARMPWGIILMVSGMSLLVAMLERTGGLDLFSAAIARFATPASITGVVAFVSGLVSAYSSTSGVVLPAFLPMAPKLVAHVGGGDVVAILSSISLGSHLVDVSPLSTIGAMCIAAAGEGVDRHRLFRQLMIWGLAMSVVGAILSQILFGVPLL